MSAVNDAVVDSFQQAIDRDHKLFVIAMMDGEENAAICHL